MDIKIVTKEKRGDGLLDVHTIIDGETHIFVGMLDKDDKDILTFIGKSIEKQKMMEKQRELEENPPEPEEI